MTFVDEPALDEEAAAGFPCDECDKVCKTQAALTSHQRNAKDHSTYVNVNERESAPKVRGASKSNTPGLEARLTASLGMIGAGVGMFGDAYCSEIVVANAPMMARTAAELAAENETMRKAFEMMSGGGAWGFFLISWGGVILAILAHHRLVPEQAVPPTVARPRPAAATNGHQPHPPATGGLPTVNDDGSMSFMGMTMSAEQIKEMSASMGLDPAMFGATAAGEPVR